MSHATQSQSEVFAFFSDPQTFGGADVKRIDTHAAAVFLAGTRALKVKRAVQFPFLDYSTLEKRRAACEAELRVNYAFAPELYRRIVPITREASGALALDGDGQAVEWALEMQRFDENATLDHLAEQGRIDAALADALARVVADAHSNMPALDGEPWLRALAAFADQNEQAFREWPQLFPTGKVAALTTESRRALPNLRPMLRKRAAAGLIRRTHGDLHMGNIVLLNGRPVLFDAIEFDPVVASGDVLYDLAFLLMDLIHRRLPVPASIVLNRYLAQSARLEDFDALAALPFFLSMRAAIRAKVTAARLEQASAADQPAIEGRAREYFDLACAAIIPPKPQLVAIGGLSGTGKSVLARALAADVRPLPGAVVLRSDVMRKRMLGASETTRLPQEAYSAEMTARVYKELGSQARRILGAGHSVIVDAVFARSDERQAIAAIAQVANVPFRGLYLSADLDTRLRRVAGRMADASDADAQVVRQQADYELGSLDWRSVDASGPAEATLARVRALLD